jgi:hypothetical protein
MTRARLDEVAAEMRAKYRPVRLPRPCKTTCFCGECPKCLHREIARSSRRQKFAVEIRLLELEWALRMTRYQRLRAVAI